MTPLFFVDAVAVIFGLLGLLLAFRRRAIGRWVAARKGQPVDQGTEDASDRDGIDAVFRMIGTMILAFSITGCAFANLFSYYAANSPN